MKVFQILLLLSIAGCSSENDEIVADEAVRKSVLEPQLKPVEEVLQVPQVKQVEKATEIDVQVIKSTNSLRKKSEKKTVLKPVIDSVEIVPWDIVHDKSWSKQNQPKFVEDPRVVVPWEE